MDRANARDCYRPPEEERAAFRDEAAEGWDDRDDFDFYPAKYNAQLVAGYSKNTPERGLMTYMPDFNDLKPGVSLRPGRRR